MMMFITKLASGENSVGENTKIGPDVKSVGARVHTYAFYLAGLLVRPIV